MWKQWHLRRSYALWPADSRRSQCTPLDCWRISSWWKRGGGYSTWTPGRRIIENRTPWWDPWSCRSIMVEKSKTNQKLLPSNWRERSDTRWVTPDKDHHLVLILVEILDRIALTGVAVKGWNRELLKKFTFQYALREGKVGCIDGDGSESTMVCSVASLSLSRFWTQTNPSVFLRVWSCYP